MNHQAITPSAFTGAFPTGAHAPRYLTADIPAIGGTLKERPSDFLVEEIPLYNPAGEGEHIFLFLEKSGMTTLQLRDAIARHFKVDRRAIGHAGLKDKDAITRQVISVHAPGQTPEDFPSFEHDRARVLWVDLHTNKLKRGHLAGNRFSIKVRGVNPLDVRHAKTALDQLAEFGVPNRIGAQRFGTLANNHLVGRALILGDHAQAIEHLLAPNPLAPSSTIDARQAYADGRLRNAYELMPKVFKAERNLLRALSNDHPPAKAIKAIDPTAVGFLISSFQSAIFNHILNQRIADHTLASLTPGDWAMVIKNRSIFHLSQEEYDTNLDELNARLAHFELAPTGPMWGTTMSRATQAVGQRELQALEQAGLTPSALEQCEADTHYPMIGGERRPLRVQLSDPEIEGGIDEHGAYIRCAFELPRGAYATTVMDEIIKPAPQTPPNEANH
ncbi:MAG: tRNA pseudouridine(13) synthase TruD [Phycisphaerales bacterium]